jgi:hypothetical protein
LRATERRDGFPPAELTAMWKWLFSRKDYLGPSKVYREAVDIYPDLKLMIQATTTRFAAVGASFDRSTKHCAPVIEDRLANGVEFVYVHLSRQADFELFARQFGQSTEELATEVDATYSVMDRYRQRYPGKFNNYPTKRCPNYRMYVSDPDSPRPCGIIIPYGSATDSPLMPAYRIDNFRAAPWATYLKDFQLQVSQQQNNKVFIIHGHAEARWRELRDLLLQIGVDPQVMVEGSVGGRTYIEKFTDIARQCAFAVAIFTPDDLVQVRSTPTSPIYTQARPNAIFEVGWFAGMLGRRRVLVLCQEGVQMFSDYQGVGVLTFRNSIEEIYRRLEQELRDEEIIR